MSDYVILQNRLVMFLMFKKSYKYAKIRILSVLWTVSGVTSRSRTHASYWPVLVTSSHTWVCVFIRAIFF